MTGAPDRRPGGESWWPFGRFLPLPPRGRRVLLVLLSLLVLGLGANAVRRAAKGKSSRYDETTEWARALVREGENVYATRPSEGTHAKYPPAFFVAVSPFALLPRVPGAALWFLLHLALGVGAVFLAVRAFRPASSSPPRGQVLLVGLLVAGVIVTNLETAQVNLAIVFLLALSLLLFAEGRDLGSGLALGAAVALKVTPALFLLHFAGKRAWKAILGAALGLFLVGGLLPALVLGPARAVEATRSWGEVLSSFSRLGALGEGTGGYRATNQSLEAAVVRALSDVPAVLGEGGYGVNVLALPLDVSRGIAKGLAVALLLLLLWLGRGRAGDRRGMDLAAQAGLFAGATLLLSPVSWVNHYAMMLIPFAAAVEGVRRRPPGDPRRRGLALVTAFAALLLLSSAVLPLLAVSLPLLGLLFLGAALAREARPASVAPATGSARGLARPR